MTRTETVDVLIVGARCAGAALAMLLARRGLRVLAIDKGDYGSDTISTHAMMRGGVLQLHRWGLLGRLRQRGTPAIRGTCFHYGAEAVRIPIKPSDGVDALYAPRRTVLDTLLVDAAREAGAMVRHRHTLVALQRNAAGRVVGAVVRDGHGESVEIAAGLTVGADGLGSVMARLVDAPVLRMGQHSTATIFGYWQGLPAEGYHWHYRPGVSAGAIPTNGGRHCVFAIVPSDRFRREIRLDVPGGYRRVLAEAAPELAAGLDRGAVLDGALKVFAGRKGVMRQPLGPGWALVGDAGYFRDPITAHGITDALRDAELLAEAAASDSSADWRDYRELRDELARPFFEGTDAVAAFDWDLHRLRELHAGLNAAMKAEVAYLAELDAAVSAA